MILKFFKNQCLQFNGFKSPNGLNKYGTTKKLNNKSEDKNRKSNYSNIQIKYG